MWFGSAAIQTSVSQARDSENLLYVFLSKNAVTKVTFSELSDKEINWYLDTEEWHGAAGGYRIQSLASCFIKSIEGTQSCVTGLPIFELYDMFKEQGYSLLE